MSFRPSKGNRNSISSTIHSIPQILVPLAITLTIYTYLYPVFLGCVFPSIDGQRVTAYKDTIVQHYDPAHINPLDTRPHLAPFRLLVLADPQLEGDSSLPDPEDALSRKIIKHWNRIQETDVHNVREVVSRAKEAVTLLITEDIPAALQAARKRLDLFGNDYYLAHIYRTLHWWSKPTHVTVLGDLIGSQWVDDEEFEWRGWRYWNRVFAGAEKVPDELMQMGSSGGGIMAFMEDAVWKNRIVNIVGNHDIGYAGDITRERIDRFEKKYGRVNWDVRFQYPSSRMNETEDKPRPMLHMVVLNSMLFDTPAQDEDLQGETYKYLNELVQHRVRSAEERHDFTLLLTHVPLHKKEGVCVDAPHFKFWEEDECSGDCRVGGLKEQNHLSDFASQPGVLNNIFGMSGDLDKTLEGRGRSGLVLNGHDHEGCDTWHYIPRDSTFRASEESSDVGEEKKKETKWDSSKWSEASSTHPHTGLREITVRSMMGEFGGNAGLLSAWFDFEIGEWQYDIQMCRFGVQHIWWAVHVIDIVTIASLLLSGLLKIRQALNIFTTKKTPGEKSLKVE